MYFLKDLFFELSKGDDVAVDLESYGVVLSLGCSVFF